VLCLRVVAGFDCIAIVKAMKTTRRRRELKALAVDGKHFGCLAQIADGDSAILVSRR
jgi:hypothetical protein